MDSGTLLKEQIDAGARLIEKFDKYAKVQVAFWLKENDTKNRYLYLVSEQINDSNFDLAYGEVGRLTRKHPDEWLDTFQIKVAGVEDPIAKPVIEIQQKYASTTAIRDHSRRLGDLYVDEIYIYPPIKPKQPRVKAKKK